MLNLAVMGIFRSKIEVKSGKSFCRGNFLFVPFNPLFYVSTMRQCFKNIPAKFQSRPTFLAGFFSKRVTDDDDRRKTFLLASCSEYSSLNYRVVTMEYRTSDRGNSRNAHAARPHSASFLQLSSSKFLDFSLCFLSFELLCLTIWSPSDFSFKAKEQLFEQTFCHLIFPVRGKSIVDSLWKSSSPVSTSEIEFTSCRSRRGKQSCTQWSCLVSSRGMIAWRGWSNRKGGRGVSVLFSFMSVDSCSSTGERKTGSATWDWQEHPTFVCFVSLSLSLSLSLFLSLSLSLSLSRNMRFLFFFSFSSLSSASAIVEIDEQLGACCSPAAEPPRKQICRRRL